VTYDFRTQQFRDGNPISMWEPEVRAGWSLEDRNLDRILSGSA
jgi:hypothetical protein